MSLRPVADTTLLESAPDFNMGAEFHVAAGLTGPMGDRTLNRGLFRFDLSSIPSGSVIRSVTLQLTVTGIPGRDGGGSSANSTFALHRMNRSWGEGTKLGFRGEFATSGEATWNHAFAPGPGFAGVAWSAPGTSATVDFNAAASATQVISGIGTYDFGPSDGMIADVQRWVNDPSINFGWLLATQEESRPKTARRFGSREEAENAPVLNIEFVPPTGLRIDNVHRDGTNIAFQFTAAAGSSYMVQFRDELGGMPWSVLTNVPPQAAESTITISTPVVGSKRFFRLAK